MRNIIFRGKSLREGKWVYGDLIQLQTRSRIHQWENYWRVSYDIDSDTIGQFTGLTDNNDNRIYEGDIVSGLFRFGMKKNALVTFKDGAFGLEWYRGDIAHFDAFTSICNVTYQVLGNIYDNPELLFKEE